MWKTDKQYDYSKIKHQEFDRDGNLIKEERFEKENENENSTKTGSDNETRPSTKDENQKESKPAQKTKTEPANGKLPPIKHSTDRLPPIDVSKAKSNSLGYSGEENQGDYLIADGAEAKSGRELRRENQEEGRAERRERNLAKIEELRQKRAERSGKTFTPIENYAEMKERDKADNNTYAIRWKTMQNQRVGG